MEWLLIALAGGGAALAGRYLWDRRRAAGAEETVDLDGVRALAEEDVTKLGEELQRFDGSVWDLDAEGRADYQRALDAYEAAQRLVPRISSADEISKVTDTLSQGRYAVACVQARLAGEPVPEKRVPCFFNPQHGPSVRDVMWTNPRRGTRTVPVCAQDAARVESGQNPEVRTVRLHGRPVPYWEAGRAYLPYTEGYFVAGAIGAASLSWAVAPPGDAGGAGQGHHGAGHGGHDGSGADAAGHGGYDGDAWGQAGHSGFDSGGGTPF